MPADAFRRVAAVAAALLLGPLAQGGGAAACPGVKRSGAWASVALPPGTWFAGFGVGFTRGGPDALYAAAGRVVRHSGDGGCTWQQVLSLDALPSPVSASRSPSYQFISVAVGPSAGGRPGPVWALAVESTTSSFTAALPVLTAVSTDAGKTWRVREAAPVEFAAGYPRCTYTSRILAGVQPGTAYVYCDDFSLGTYVVVAGHCRTSFYVTRDGGATWPPVYGDQHDPAGVTDTARFGCPPTFSMPPMADRYRPRTVWTAVDDGVLRSTEDGAAPKPFAPYPLGGDLLSGVEVGVLPSGKPLVLLRTQSRLLWSAGGKATEFATLPIRVSERGRALGAEPVERSDRVFVAYIDSVGHPTAWLYDLARATWKRLPPLPARADQSPAWQNTGAVEMFEDPASPYLYARQHNDGTVLRYAIR
jgi:hypothetical protein